MEITEEVYFNKKVELTCAALQSLILKSPDLIENDNQRQNLAYESVRLAEYVLNELGISE